MKCPHCKEETRGGKTCEKCGQELSSRQRVDVQYKDFKITELLDIRISKPIPEDKESETQEADVKGKPAFRKVPAETHHTGGNKITVYLLISLVIVLFLIAGFLLLEFLLRR